MKKNLFGIEHRFIILIVLACLACATGLFLGTRFDLILDQTLYNPTAIWAITMEAIGWWVLYLPMILLFLLKSFNTPPKNKKVTLFWYTLAGGAQLALFLIALHYWQNRGLIQGIFSPFSVIFFVLVAAVFYLCTRYLAAQNSYMRTKLLFFARFGSLYLLCNLTLVNILKLIWQRPRYDEMLATDQLANFTAWYHPFGPGGSSFPSGHTASACGILLLFILCDLFPTWQARKLWVSLFSWAYIGLMAFSRLVMGRHFLTDTVAAMFLMAILFVCLHHSKCYRKSLLQVLSAEKEERT